jgi:hypothetical protein
MLDTWLLYTNYFLLGVVIPGVIFATKLFRYILIHNDLRPINPRGPYPWHLIPLSLLATLEQILLAFLGILFGIDALDLEGTPIPFLQRLVTYELTLTEGGPYANGRLYTIRDGEGGLRAVVPWHLYGELLYGL